MNFYFCFTKDGKTPKYVCHSSVESKEYRMLRTFYTFSCFTIFCFATVLGWSLFFFLFTTRFWLISILYFGWMVFDNNTPDSGGRQKLWISNAKYWEHIKNYFPATTEFVPGVSLNPRKNYLFLCYPHGIIPLGPPVGLTRNLRKLYPKFSVQTAILRGIFYTPFLREYILAAGATSCAERGLNYILSQPGGGNIVNLFPGGALEAYYCHPEVYKIVINKRKGFVRVALKTGAPLVPVFTFGENKIFNPVKIVGLKWLQEYVRKKLGFTPVLFHGRWCLWFPRRCALTSIVGKPIEVVKNDSPTSQEIEEVHKVFVEEMVKLFETYKWKFEENPEKAHLEIE